MPSSQRPFFSEYSKTDRIFTSDSDNVKSNLQAWRDGIASAKKLDEVGVLKALQTARGSAKALSQRGTPLRNICSKTILSIKDEPQAWRRLQEAHSNNYFSTAEGDFTEWMPYSVSLFELLWALNPTVVAKAAQLWCKQREAQTQDYKTSWWSCPFMIHPYESRAQLHYALLQAGRRHFETAEHYEELINRQADLKSYGSGHALNPEVLLPNDDSERQALTLILKSVVRGCLDALWRNELHNYDTRKSQKTVWSHSDSDYELAFSGIHFNLNAPALNFTEFKQTLEAGEKNKGSATHPFRPLPESALSGPLPPKRPTLNPPLNIEPFPVLKPLRVLDAVVQDIISETLDQDNHPAITGNSSTLASPQPSLEDQCRRIILGAGSNRLSLDLMAFCLKPWYEKNPHHPEGLPFKEFDWLPYQTIASLCDEVGISDLSLGRWLKCHGSKWSMPASFTYHRALKIGSPCWASTYVRVNDDYNDQKIQGLSEWSCLEWMLFKKPAAVREACLLGASVNANMEAVLAHAQPGNSKDWERGESIDVAKTSAWLEACRVTEVSLMAIPSASVKKSMTL